MVKTGFSFFIFLALTLAHAIAWADFEQDLSATGNINHLQALRELRARAVAGDADAQLNMGGVFFKGQEVGQDDAEAAKWFLLAAGQGHPQARFNLGMMYATGQGVAQDHAEAAKWYRLAADQGLALAQLNLGVAYVTGQGVLKNEIEAARWIRLAANQGEVQAQFNLAVMYTNGQGLKQNFTEAHRWARLAALQGHETAHALAQDLARRMAPEQQAANRTDIENNSTPSSGTGEYYLQLAAFKSRKEAENYLAEMRVKLLNIDKPSSIFTSDGWVRTQLGPYDNLEEAHRNAKSLKARLGYEPLLKQH